MQKYEFSQETMPNLFPGYVGSVDVQHQRETIWLHAAVCRAVTTSYRDPRVEAIEINVSAGLAEQCDSTVGSWQNYPGLQVEPWEYENHRHSFEVPPDCNKNSDSHLL